MQSIRAYEYNYLYSSDFCNLFTLEEWEGSEHTLDIKYYYDYSYGSPFGRAQGIGWLQEVLARLEHHYILSSNSSVDSTITDDPQNFPLNQKLYADFSHDDILISIMTAMSIHYFKDLPSLTGFPASSDRKFILSNITPFAARLVLEVVGCAAEDPTPVHNHRTQYRAAQYGYDASNATNKFIRMRFNNGILPLSTIRGGYCEGRSDELCPMASFMRSQANAYELSNYDYVCFGNYTLSYPNGGMDFDR
jgi:Histidine phosphatase superfamily (branch 2)